MGQGVCLHIVGQLLGLGMHPSDFGLAVARGFGAALLWLWFKPVSATADFALMWPVQSVL